MRAPLLDGVAESRLTAGQPAALTRRSRLALSPVNSACRMCSAATTYGAKFSVSSIYVPQGSVRYAIASVSKPCTSP